MRLKSAKLLQIQAEVHALGNGEEYSTASLTEEAAGYARDRRGMDPHGRGMDGLDLQIADRAEAIADRMASSRRARRFADIAYGRSTPISIAAQE